MLDWRFSHSASKMSSKGTYPLSRASANLIGETMNVTWVSHEDCRSNLRLGGGGYRDRGTTETFIRVTPSTVSVIKYLTTLISDLGQYMKFEI
jgi:hypothetical protein